MVSCPSLSYSSGGQPGVFAGHRGPVYLVEQPDRAVQLGGEVPELWRRVVLGQVLKGVRRAGDIRLPGPDQVLIWLEHHGQVLGQVGGFVTDSQRIAARYRGADQLVGGRAAVVTDLAAAGGVEQAERGRVRVVRLTAEILHRPLVVVSGRLGG